MSRTPLSLLHTAVSIPLIAGLHFGASAGPGSPVRTFGVLSLAETGDSVHIDFSLLDTPQTEVFMSGSAVPFADMTLRRMLGASSGPPVFLLCAPFSGPDVDSQILDFQSLFGTTGATLSGWNVDSLRDAFLAAVEDVNPSCASRCRDTIAGPGVFLRTSENGIAFWKPLGRYIGGIDRYIMFWAYSSDGSFGAGTVRAALPGAGRGSPAGAQTRPRASSPRIHDLCGRRILRPAAGLVVEAGGRDSRAGASPRIRYCR